MRHVFPTMPSPNMAQWTCLSFTSAIFMIDTKSDWTSEQSQIIVGAEITSIIRTVFELAELIQLECEL